MGSVEQYALVAIATDRFQDIGVLRGMTATVLDVYDNGECEIQVHDDVPEDLLTVKPDDIYVSPEQAAR